MDTPTTVPASYRLRRTVPPYKPARTPYVGKTVTMHLGRYANSPDAPYAVIRETEGNGTKPGYYWIAPILPDGTLGKMTTALLTKEELQA